MKQITAIFLCLFFGAVSVASAQGLKVSVLNDAEEPLPHAYVYVNGRAVAVADTLGLAVIPQDKLKLGDTISISYVATEGQSVVFDQNLSTRGEYEFVLEESHGTLHADAVMIKANIKKLYRKSLPIHRYPSYGFYGLYSTHFTMNITNPGDSLPSHSVAGRLGGVHTSPYIHDAIFPNQYRSVIGHSLNPNPAVLDSLQMSGFHVGFVNDYPLEITTLDDTTGLSETLKYFLPRALQNKNLALWRVYDPEPYSKDLEVYPNLKVNYGYLGKDRDTSTFRLIYSGHGAGTTSEVVVKIEVADRINPKIVEVALSFKDTINENSYYVKAKVRNEYLREFMLIRDIEIGKIRFMTPIELEYRITESDGRRVNIMMNNYNIRSLFHEIQKQNLSIKQFVEAESISWLELLHFQHEEIEYYLERMALEKKRLEKMQQLKMQRAKERGQEKELTLLHIN